MTGEAVNENLTPYAGEGNPNELASGTTAIRGDAGSHDRTHDASGDPAARVKVERKKGESCSPEDAWEGVNGARYGQSARIPTRTDEY